MDLSTGVSHALSADQHESNDAFMLSVRIDDTEYENSIQSESRQRSSEASENSELPNIEHVPYLLESDCLLSETTSLGNQVSEDVYHSAAMSHHSYSQTLQPNITNECLHNYSQPLSRTTQNSNAEVLHNYSQPWPQSTDSFTSVHNYCINNISGSQSKEPQLNCDTKIFKLANKDTIDESGSCLKLEMIDIVVCQWDDCVAAFHSVKLLSDHVQTHIKSQLGWYACLWKDCPRRDEEFGARYKLVNHLRRHTSERPHKCSLCQAEFATSEGLTKHQRVHTGEKPYPCTFAGCDKAFKNSGDRYKHVQTHKTKYPYPCKFLNCKRKYTDPGSLRKHVRKFHKEKGNDTSGQSHVEQRIQSASLLSSSGLETSLDINGLTMLSFRGALVSEETKQDLTDDILNDNTQSQTHNYSKPQPQHDKITHLLNTQDNSQSHNNNVGGGCQEAPLDLTTPIVPVSVNEMVDNPNLEHATIESQADSWANLFT